MSVAIGNKIVAGNAGIVDAGGLVLYDRIPFTSTDNILDWAKKIQSPTIKAVTNEYPVGLPTNTSGIVECYPTNDGDKILTFQTTYDNGGKEAVKIYNLYIGKDDTSIDLSDWVNSTLSEFMANIEAMFENTVSWGKGKFMTSGDTVLAWANSCTKNDSIAVVDTYFPSDLPIQLEGSLSTIIMADSDRKIVLFYTYGDGTTSNISTIYMRSIFESEWRGGWIKMTEGVAVVNPVKKAFITATPTTDSIQPIVDTNVYLGENDGELVAKTFTGTLSGNATTATTLKTSRLIDGVSFNGSANIVHYGECGTEAATVEKVVACTGFTLGVGATIRVRFKVTNTATAPKLNVNNTGAKQIQYRNINIDAHYLQANRVYEFTYDGNSYELVGDVTPLIKNSNTTKAYITGTTSNTTNTDGQIFDTGVYLSTTAGELVATTFKGALDGNAKTATSATSATSQSTVATNNPNKYYLRAIGSGTVEAINANCPSGAIYGQYEK